MAQRSGDWFCPLCQFSIYARKDKCSKCLYRRGDWFCETCRIGNDPSVAQCSVCHKNKPDEVGGITTTSNTTTASTPRNAPTATQPDIVAQLVARLVRAEQRLDKLEKKHRAFRKEAKERWYEPDDHSAY